MGKTFHATISLKSGVEVDLGPEEPKNRITILGLCIGLKTTLMSIFTRRSPISGRWDRPPGIRHSHTGN